MGAKAIYVARVVPQQVIRENPRREPGDDKARRDQRAAEGAAPRADRLRVARILSAVIAALMAVASLGGLWISDLYRDPESLAAMYRAYDLVTLAVVTPVLVISLLPGLRNSPRARLVWLSMLAYGVYNYALYVFGAAFNAFFLLHVALLSLSGVALGLGLASVDVADLRARFSDRTPARWVSAILAFLGVGLAGIWVFYALRFAITGAFPAESELVLPDQSVHLAYALDLSLLAPAYLFAAALLWRRAAWGYLLGTVLLVYSVLYQVNYLTGLLFQYAADIPGATPFDPNEPLIVVLCLAGAGLLLGNLRRGGAQLSAPQRGSSAQRG